MRLINTKTLEVEEFIADIAPTYAILSHRWGDEEVTLQDMLSKTPSDKAGYSKIIGACTQARKDKLDYVWIDSCCIDKTSSADLSEAINSMFNLYKTSRVCYAYLFDVDGTDEEMLAQSIWFTRGWTLQELIAPRNLVFYDRHWQRIGTKDILVSDISRMTKIDKAILRGADLNSVSIAKRMCWASNRTTTRIEDVAYSLLGIFGVSMPMLYGEGENAFIRLQEEIMKNSDDHSLFAWTSNDDCLRGLLAKSPASFAQCHDVVQSEIRLNPVPYSITNMGLSICLSFAPWAMDTYVAALDCELEEGGARLGIFIQKQNQYLQSARVVVEGCDRITISEKNILPFSQLQIYVKQSIWGSPQFSDSIYGFWIQNLPSELDSQDITGAVELFDVKSWNRWDDQERVLHIPTGTTGNVGVFWFNSKPKNTYLDGYGNEVSYFKLGFDGAFRPRYEVSGSLWGGLGNTVPIRESHLQLNRPETRQIQAALAKDLEDLVKEKNYTPGEAMRQLLSEYEKNFEPLGPERSEAMMENKWINQKYTENSGEDFEVQEGRYLISFFQDIYVGQKVWAVKFKMINPSLNVFFCIECCKWHCGAGLKILGTDPGKYMCFFCFSGLDASRRSSMFIEKMP